MVTLAFHTSASREYVAVLHGVRTYETSWISKKDESEKLLPTIEKTLKKGRLTLQEVDRVIVTKGPGPFSSLRIGVTVATIMGRALGIPVFAMNTMDFWRARLPKKHKKAVLVVPAGGKFVALQKPHGDVVQGVPLEEAFSLAEASDEPLEFFGELTENGSAYIKHIPKKKWKWIPESKLNGFAETIKSISPSLLTKESPVTPLYFKPPTITLPLHV